MAAKGADRLEVLDLDLEDAGQGVSGGVHKSRQASDDWVEAVRSRAAAAKRRAAATKRRKERLWLRLEWPSTGQRRDWLDPRAQEPEPPQWVDVIAPSGDDLVRVRLVPGPDGPLKQRVEVCVGGDREVTSELRRSGLAWLEARIDGTLAEDFRVGRLLGSKWRKPTARPGRAKRPDVFYAERALRYVEAQEASPRAPIAFLVKAAKASGRSESEAMWRAWLNRARSRDLLTASPAGKPGGELTAKAERLLGISKGRKVR